MIPVSKKYQKCINPIGAYSGIMVGDTRIMAGLLKCNSWTCPGCAPKMKKQLFSRIYQGQITQQPIPRYGLKFLTLTYPGAASRTGKQPYEIYEEMSYAYTRLVKGLKREFGKFHYFKVCELQKDGTPHFHVLLAGKAIVPKDVLTYIQHLWCNVLKMGFVRINVVPFKNAKHAINYLLKYLTKEIKKPGHKKRIFTASNGALIKRLKTAWRIIKVYQGPVDVDKDSIIMDIASMGSGIETHGKFQCLQPARGSRYIERLAFENRMISLTLNKLIKRELPNYDYV